ncbi:uncharacterized protein LOC123013859 [Tribolium madens]|uniref:uncharacterized protein LOC123013859 n=1 Tax=Tribolium madens TaxID=41895 RepID=UPI001CF748AB|nr:uncharacterized protein LOC123013859 [Tribolium madens]
MDWCSTKNVKRSLFVPIFSLYPVFLTTLRKRIIKGTTWPLLCSLNKTDSMWMTASHLWCSGVVNMPYYPALRATVSIQPYKHESPAWFIFLQGVISDTNKPQNNSFYLI